MNILLSHQPVVVSGGAERATLDLGAALRDLGHNVYLWGPWHSCPEFVSIAHDAGLDMLPCTAWTKLGEMRALRRACEAHEISVVLSHGRRYNALTPFAVGGLPCKHIPVLRAQVTGWDEPRNKSIAYRIAQPAWNRFWIHMLKRAPRVICISNGVANDCCKKLLCDSSHTVVIYDAVGVCAGNCAAVSQPKPRSPFRLVLVGRLQPVKRFHLIVPLMKEILTFDRDVYAEIAGAGECREEIDRSIVEAGLADNIILLGHRRDMKEIYERAHVLVHFRADEGFGRIYVEAQRSGVPVVAVRGGGTGEVVRDGETGFLHEHSDLQGMAASVLRLKREANLYESMSAKAREWAARFSVRDMARQYEELFQSLPDDMSPQHCGGDPRKQLQTR
jgi:glycosyltransferase involved in cell wall biosynthesis